MLSLPQHSPHRSCSSQYVARGFAVAVPLVPTWRDLVAPSCVSARRGPPSFAGFAKLVAWEAALTGDTAVFDDAPFYDCATFISFVLIFFVPFFSNSFATLPSDPASRRQTTALCTPPPRRSCSWRRARRTP